MALTKDEQEVLRLARERVAAADNNSGAFLCNNISRVAVENPFLDHAAQFLRSYIAQVLNGHVTLESWQRAHQKRSISKGAVQDRLDWIDFMLGLH